MQIFYHRKENSLIHSLLGCFIMVMNWVEWPIWAKIIHVNSISKCAMRVRFEITSMISDQNCTTQGSTTTLLHPFWNCPNTGLGRFKYFINAALSWFEIKFIHFFGGKKRFGNKSCKICHMTLFVFHFLQFDSGYFKQAWKSDWLLCF